MVSMSVTSNVNLQIENINGIAEIVSMSVTSDVDLQCECQLLLVWIYNSNSAISNANLQLEY